MLALRVKPGPEESLVGFLSRLAERNGVPIEGVQGFLRSIGLPFTSIGVLGTKRADLTAIARNAGLAASQLDGMAFWREPSGLIRIGLGLVRRHDIGMAYRKVCPECLAETGVHRRSWHLKAVNVCVTHRIPLVSRCSWCRQTLGWHTSSVTRCSCGQDLRRVTVAKMTDPTLRGTATVLAALGIDPAGHGPAFKRPPQIAALHASDLISLILHLGWFSEYGGVLPRSTFSESFRHLIPTALNAGAALISDWPVGVLRLFDRMARQGAARPGRFGLRRDLGPVANWITELDEGGPLKGLMLRAIADWVSTRQHAPTRVKSLRQDEGKSEPMTISDGARRLNLRRERLRDFARANDLIVYRPEKAGSGAPLLTTRLAIEHLRKERNDLISQRSSASLLGCGRETFRWLAEGGVLPPAQSPASKLLNKPVWSMTDLAVFVETIVDMSSPCFKSCQKRPMSLVRALRLLGRRGWSAHDAVQALAQGQWGPPLMISTKPGLGGLAAPKGMIAATAVDRAPDLLTIPAVAQMLGVKQEVAYRMVRLGFIGTTSARGCPGFGRLVNRNELLRFETTYLLPSRTDCDLKRRKGSTAQELIALGLRPLMGPRVDGSRQYLFNRSEVAAAWQLVGREPLP